MDRSCPQGIQLGLEKSEMSPVALAMSLDCQKRRTWDTVMMLSSAPSLRPGREAEAEQRRGGLPSRPGSTKAQCPPVLPTLLTPQLQRGGNLHSQLLPPLRGLSRARPGLLTSGSPQQPALSSGQHALTGQGLTEDVGKEDVAHV